MAWEARSGLKLDNIPAVGGEMPGRNGLGSPFGIEPSTYRCRTGPSCRRNGLGSPFGIETIFARTNTISKTGRNGLGSPFGIENTQDTPCAPLISNVGMAWEARSGLKQEKTF